MTADDVVSLLAGQCLPQVPRALALMDRDPLSPTYGSMDRTYWYYRTLTNFPGAVWQQPMVGFAALARARHATNPFADNAAVLEAARAALLAWTRTQHRNGAFDEWYRNEYSYCPTAITTAGAVVALDFLDDAIDASSRRRVLDAASRAGRWLAPRYNAGVMNQNLASAVALAGLARLQDDREWRTRTSGLLQRIAADQSGEGWFPEYGGFDFGYSTLALDFLALLGRLGFSEQADPMATRLAQFLATVLSSNRAVPGRLGSRGTAHVFPFGAIELAARVPDVRGLADLILGLHASELAAGPAAVDDRYFAYFYFPAFCLAYHAAVETGAPASVPRQEQGELAAPHSGLALWRRHGATVVVNRRLGGAAALLRPGGPALYHLGYTVAIGRARYSSAGWRGLHPRESMEGDTTRTSFSAVSGGLPLRWLTIPFQLVVHALVAGRLAEAFQSAVKRLMVNPGRTIPLTLDRRVTFTVDGLCLDDVLRPGRSLPIEGVSVTNEPTMHSPSARQDGSESVALDPETQGAVRAALRRGQSIALRWTIRLDTGQAEARVTG